MRFLLNGLNGREALLIDPAKANDHRVLAEKFGFTDMLAQLFGEVPKAYIAEDGTGVIPIAGVIGKSLSPLEKICLLYTSPSPRDRQKSRMPSSA